MKNTLSPTLVRIANRVARIPFAKDILKPFYYRYKDYLDYRRNKAYQRNALDALSEFNRCMNENGYDYILIFGTLLGAIREKGFIKHDMDIDTAMWFEDYDLTLVEKLACAGFRLDHRYEVDGGDLALELTFVFKEVSIDLFCIYPPIDEYPYISSKWAPVNGCVNNEESMKKLGFITGKRLEMPLTKDIILVPFETLMLPVPKNSDEVLSFYYGEDYMNPNPNWSESSDFPYRKPWSNHIAKLIKY